MTDQIRNFPDLYALRCFHAVAVCGGYSRAAEQLFISRQALTKTIRRMEQNLGGSLFNRKGNVLALTELGNFVLSHSEPVLHAYDKFEREMTGFFSRQMPVLSLAASHGCFLSLEEGVLARFGQRNPEFLIDSEEVSDDNVLELVRQKEVEIGLVGSAAVYLKEFECRFFRSTGICLQFPASHPLAQKEALLPRDLSGQPIVGAGRHNHLQRFFLESCRRAGVEPVFQSITTYQNKQERVYGFYFSFPEEILSPRSGWVTRPLLVADVETFGTYVITRRENCPLSRPAQSFLSFLQNRYGGC